MTLKPPRRPRRAPKPFASRPDAVPARLAPQQASDAASRAPSRRGGSGAADKTRFTPEGLLGGRERAAKISEWSRALPPEERATFDEAAAPPFDQEKLRALDAYERRYAEAADPRRRDVDLETQDPRRPGPYLSGDLAVPGAFAKADYARDAAFRKATQDALRLSPTFLGQPEARNAANAKALESLTKRVRDRAQKAQEVALKRAAEPEAPAAEDTPTPPRAPQAPKPGAQAHGGAGDAPSAPAADIQAALSPDAPDRPDGAEPSIPDQAMEAALFGSPLAGPPLDGAPPSIPLSDDDSLLILAQADGAEGPDEQSPETTLSEEGASPRGDGAFIAIERPAPTGSIDIHVDQLPVAPFDPSRASEILAAGAEQRAREYAGLATDAALSVGQMAAGLAAETTAGQIALLALAQAGLLSPEDVVRAIELGAAVSSDLGDRVAEISDAVTAATQSDLGILAALEAAGRAAVADLEALPEEARAAAEELSAAAAAVPDIVARAEALAASGALPAAVAEQVLEMAGAAAVDLVVQTQTEAVLRATPEGRIAGRMWDGPDRDALLERIDMLADVLDAFDPDGARHSRSRLAAERRAIEDEDDATIQNRLDRMREDRLDDNIGRGDPQSAYWLWRLDELRDLSAAPTHLQVAAPRPGEDGRPTTLGERRYHTLDNHGRATGVTATLTAADLGRVGQSTPPDVPGWEQRPDLHRSHLLGRIFRGADDPRNIVALERWANTPTMRLVEASIQRALERGETVRLRVQPLYRRGRMSTPPTPSELRPVGMIILARGSGGYSARYLVMNVQRPEQRRRDRPIGRRGI